MVRESNSKLIPVLIQFLQKCQPSSSEQYLALLVLNNVSIPEENKRFVGVENRGAEVLARLFCKYPGIPLIGIILVNLSFCDGMIRKELVDDLNGGIQLVEALIYVLKVGCVMDQILIMDAAAVYCFYVNLKYSNTHTNQHSMHSDIHEFD